MNNKTNTEVRISEYKFVCITFKRARGVAVTFVLRALNVGFRIQVRARFFSDFFKNKNNFNNF